MKKRPRLAHFLKNIYRVQIDKKSSITFGRWYTIRSCFLHQRRRRRRITKARSVMGSSFNSSFPRSSFFICHEPYDYLLNVFIHQLTHQVSLFILIALQQSRQNGWISFFQNRFVVELQKLTTDKSFQNAFRKCMFFVFSCCIMSFMRYNFELLRIGLTYIGTLIMLTSLLINCSSSVNAIAFHQTTTTKDYNDRCDHFIPIRNLESVH